MAELLHLLQFGIMVAGYNTETIMARQLIEGFDYRSDRPIKKTRKQWRSEVKAAIDAGGKRKIVEGETFITLPVVEDLGAPFFKRTKQVIAVEIYSNIPG